MWPADAMLKTPAFYARTCGSDICIAADEAKRAVPANERVSARQADPREAMMRKLEVWGCPAALERHVIADFEYVDAPPKPCNVLLNGPNGTGKSALSVALLAAWNPTRALWTSAYRILSRIKSTFRRQANESETDVMDDLVSLPVLVIDDLGAQQNTEFGLATLYEVVKERCENYKPTIVTTNLTLTEIDKLEPRLASRLGAFKIIKLAGDDRRLA